MLTKEMQSWQSIMGRKYTERNLVSTEEMETIHKKYYGMSRTEMNSRFLGSLDRSLSILEVGCNIGNQLLCLQGMGFNNLCGIELQAHALQIARTRLKDIELSQGSIFNLPFKTAFFDLVFTSGVLIHIAPHDLGKALREIYRCTRRYIWGWEYYAPTSEDIIWHGEIALLWRNDFSGLYQQQCPSLKLIREERFRYLHQGNHESVGSMFLLRK